MPLTVFSRYNSVGQLTCVLCNAPVKSALMWNAHVQGKTHKEVNVNLTIKSHKTKLSVITLISCFNSENKLCIGYCQLSIKEVNYLAHVRILLE